MFDLIVLNICYTFLFPFKIYFQIFIFTIVKIYQLLKSVYILLLLSRNQTFTQTEILRERLELIGSTEPYVGKYFSEEYIRRHVLHQDDETILRIDSQINKETEQNPEPEETDQPEV